MKSFLVKGKRPIIKWGMLPHGIFYEGKVPEGFKLAITPSEGYVILDVDRHGKVDGFSNIPEHLKEELASTLHYRTKNDGGHYWFRYTGKDDLANKASHLGIDLRTHKGYVVWYADGDIRDREVEIKDSSEELNYWLETLFGFIKD